MRFSHPDSSLIWFYVVIHPLGEFSRFLLCAFQMCRINPRQCTLRIHTLTRTLIILQKQTFFLGVNPRYLCFRVLFSSPYAQFYPPAVSSSHVKSVAWRENMWRSALFLIGNRHAVANPSCKISATYWFNILKANVLIQHVFNVNDLDRTCKQAHMLAFSFGLFNPATFPNQRRVRSRSVDCHLSHNRTIAQELLTMSQLMVSAYVHYLSNIFLTQIDS